MLRKADHETYEKTRNNQPEASCLFVCFVVVFLIGLNLFHTTESYATETRPNVIVVMTDDQGYGDLGIHGNPHVKTPHLDQFARDGVQFSRFYCSPVCAPTRASLLTGRYYYRTGVIHTSRGGAKMHGDEVTVAEWLGQSGYQTGIFGKWHLGDNYPMRPQDQGFAETLVHRSGGIDQTPDKPNSYFDPRLWKNGKPVQSNGYCTDVFFQAALEFIEAHREQPFFCYIPTNAPHTPLQVADKFVQPYLDKGLDETTARVYGMVENIDDNFGRLLDKLDELQLRRNTLLIFLTDNGPQQNRFNAGLRGRKSHTYEGGIRVPFFVQWPARCSGGRVIDRVAAHIDLLPTILDAATGSSATKVSSNDGRSRSIDGVSLVPLLTGNPKSWPDRVLFFQCHRGLQPQSLQNCAVVTQQYKLVGSPGTFSRENFQSETDRKLELYDLQSDSGEKSDMASTIPSIKDRLVSAYHEWFSDVRSERNFTPGVISIGNSAEELTHLCRYQDGNYRDGVPDGWTVRVERGGDYLLSIDRGEILGDVSVRVRWQGGSQQLELSDNEKPAIIQLSRGNGVLRIQLLDSTGEPVVFTDNGTAGDVQLARVQDQGQASSR